MDITIIGVGLIGGSIALSLKEKGFANHIYGVDIKKDHSSLAKELGLVEEIYSLENLPKSDLYIISVPVDSSIEILKTLLEKIPENAVITDVGSTKELICESVENHPKRKCFVASHPIAGTEHSGPEAAINNLFNGKTTIICDKEKSSSEAFELVKKMYETLEMKVVYMDSKEHDLHVAYVSHLSHISSFALGITVLNKENDEENIFNLAGSGFESTVRLAKSSPHMWNPIFKQNSKYISESLGDYIKCLQMFKDSIDNDQFDNIFYMMMYANKIRKVLKDIKKIQ
jgi:prephenate dehydrogenase